MLILTRKQGETVVIGNSVQVKVLGCTSGSVRLGFEAPPDVSIYREEIVREIATANQAASQDQEPAHARPSIAGNTEAPLCGSSSK